MSLDTSFTIIFSLLIYAMFVAGMVSLALTDLSRDDRQHNPTSDEYEYDTYSEEIASINQAIIDGQASSDTYDPASNDEHYRMTNQERSIAKLTAVIAVATVIYSVVAIFQWNAMLASNGINHEAMISVQRAFVFATGASMERTGPKLRAGQQLQKGYSSAAFIVNVQNSGNSPARKARTVVNACIRDTNDLLPADFSFPDYMPPATEGVLLPPKSPTSNYIVTTPETVDAIVGGQDTLYLWGAIFYFDIFNNPHKTEYCFHYSGFKLDTTNDTITFNFDQCQHHNCADEDCPDSWGNNADKSGCRSAN